MNREAFEQVARSQKDRVFGYATRMLRRRPEAQDVVQEALVRMWQHRDKIDSDTAAFWLRRTTHNLCIDRIRRRKANPEVDAGVQEELSADRAAGPVRLAESGELGRLIEAALGRMPQRDRAVLLMREVDGMPYREISEILDIPLGTLKARLHRAREQLRGKLVRAGVTP